MAIEYTTGNPSVNPAEGDETFPEAMPGFQVTVCCRTDDGVSPVTMV